MTGLSTGAADEKMGLRGSTTGQVILQDCFVSDDCLLGGQEGVGFKAALQTLDAGRVTLSAGAVGQAQQALDLRLSYARQRTQFGQPIASFQAVQWMLADTATEVHAARLMVYEAAHKLDEGLRLSREAAMVKLFATEVAGRAADRAVQVFGGLGYMKAAAVERIYRDVRVLRIYEGTNEIQRLVIAEDLIKNG
jgi:alkylation response protein AidB-like acyl-CoA dehydrogenase